MKIKEVKQKLGYALLCGAFLAGVAFGGSYFYNSLKKEKETWSKNIPNYYQGGKQYYHPSELKVLKSLTRHGKTDIYVYEPSLASHFLSGLSYKLNDVLNANISSWGLGMLTADKAVDKDPAYSPDGEYIAFSSNKFFSNFDIWIMDKDGKVKAWITKYAGDETKPVWINDRTLKYHIVEDGKLFYETIKLKGEHPIQTYEVLERVSEK